MMKKSLFSLIELVIVIAILGLGAAILVPTLSPAQQSAAIQAEGIDLSTIQVNVDQYYLAEGKYPTLIQPTETNPIKLDFDQLYPTYIQSLPKNPNSIYWVDFNGQVWTSFRDSPKVQNQNSGLVTWEAIPGSTGYRLYELENGPTASMIKTRIFKYHVVAKQLPPTQLSYQGIPGRTYLVSSLDEKGESSAPVGTVDYDSKPKPLVPIPAPLPLVGDIGIQLNGILSGNTANLSLQTDPAQIATFSLVETYKGNTTMKTFNPQDIFQKNENGKSVYSIPRSGLGVGTHAFQITALNKEGKVIGTSKMVPLSLFEKPIITKFSIKEIDGQTYQLDYDWNTEVTKVELYRAGVLVQEGNNQKNFIDKLSGSLLSLDSLLYTLKVSNPAGEAVSTQQLPFIPSVSIQSTSSTSNSITLHVSANNAKQLDVYRKVDGKYLKVATISGNAGTFTDTSLNSSTDYTYQLVASNGILSRTSAAYVASTKSATVLQPLIQTVTQTVKSENNLSFSVVSQNTTKVEIYDSASKLLKSWTGATGEVSVSNLQPGTSYPYVIRAWNGTQQIERKVNFETKAVSADESYIAFNPIERFGPFVYSQGSNYVRLNTTANQFNRIEVYVNGVLYPDAYYSPATRYYSAYITIPNLRSWTYYEVDVKFIYPTYNVRSNKIWAYTLFGMD